MTAEHIFESVVLALAFAGMAASAHGDKRAVHRAFDPATAKETSFGRPGNPARINKTIHASMHDTMRFTPSNVTVKAGQTVQFVISNRGRTLHEMVIGTAQALQAHAELMRRFPEMEHDAGHMAHVKPGKSAEIVWQFTQPGEYRFACMLPGHMAAGMRAKVVVL